MWSVEQKDNSLRPSKNRLGDELSMNIRTFSFFLLSLLSLPHHNDLASTIDDTDGILEWNRGLNTGCT